MWVRIQIQTLPNYAALRSIVPIEVINSHHCRATTRAFVSPQNFRIVEDHIGLSKISEFSKNSEIWLRKAHADDEGRLGFAIADGIPSIAATRHSG